MYEMRAPRIRVKTRKATLKRKVGTLRSGCAICKNKCIDVQNERRYDCVWCTRSVSKLMKEFSKIIIYETYRCMPLLGNEKINAPDWEEHIVRYHIVFVKNNS